MTVDPPTPAGKRVVELFAGVGGFRLGLERAGHEVVWANEWDKYACDVYDKNYGGQIDRRDITTVEPSDLPAHDLICGGFPCQAFSIAGKRRGFEETRGTLFFEIMRLARACRTPYLFLENVKGLLNHDQGRTFETILRTLDESGYDCQWQVLNSKDFGVPQNRERVFIIGHLRTQPRPEVFPIGSSGGNDIEQLNGEVHQDYRIYGTDGIAPALASNRGGGSAAHPQIATRQPLRVKEATKQGYAEAYPGDSINLAQPNSDTRRGRIGRGVANTLETGVQQAVVETDERMMAMRWQRSEKGRKARRESQKQGRDYTPFSDGHRELLPVEGKAVGALTSQAIAKDSLIGNESRIRRLTPVECERLQGFPDNWTEGVSDTQRYKQMGNAVTVNVIEAIGARL